MNITKEHVDLYVVGKLGDPALVRAIEQAYDSADPEVRARFERYGVTPAAIRDEEIEEETQRMFFAPISPASRKLGLELCQEIERDRAAIKRFVQWLAELRAASRAVGGMALREAKSQVKDVAAGAKAALDVLDGFVIRRHGGFSVPLAASGKYGCYDKWEPSVPQLPEPPYREVHAGTLYVAQPEDAVPYGVVRITARRKDEPLATRLLVMRFNAGKRMWWLQRQIAELFAGLGSTEGVAIDIQPARDDLLEWFPLDEVEALAPDVAHCDAAVKERFGRLVERLKGQTANE